MKDKKYQYSHHDPVVFNKCQHCKSIFVDRMHRTTCLGCIDERGNKDAGFFNGSTGGGRRVIKETKTIG